jgi:CRP/FNR family cyclic AMP-dependent transcriptional regulator
MALALDERFFEKFGVEYAPGDIIFCEWEPGNEFYFIQSGTVRIVKLINNREKNISDLVDGDVFGEMAILEEQPRSATAIALDRVKLLKFHRDNFDALLSGNPALAYKLLVIFSKRIYEAKRRLMILLLEEPQLRVMDVMVMLAEKDPHLDFQNEITLSVTAQDIARWAGLTEEDAQKELTHLSRTDKIEMFGDKIVVRKIREFQRLVASRRKSMYQ